MGKAILGAVALLAGILLSSCATSDRTDIRDVKEEKHYVTGSNLPKKDNAGVNVLKPEALENAIRDSAAINPAPTR